MISKYSGYDYYSRNDFVKVYDGGTIFGVPIGNLTGEATLPAGLSSSDQFILINFVTDSAMQKYGFRIRYTGITWKTLHGCCIKVKVPDI